MCRSWVILGDFCKSDQQLQHKMTDINLRSRLVAIQNDIFSTAEVLKNAFEEKIAETSITLAQILLISRRQLCD